MKNVLALFLLFMVAVSAFAAEGKQVSYKSGDEAVQGLLYTPAGKGPFPAIIVIHEYWGLNDWVKEQASKLADQGYVALAIDLYRGKVATTPDEAHEIMRGVPEDRAKRDLARRVRSSCNRSPTSRKTGSPQSAGAWEAATRSMSPFRSPRFAPPLLITAVSPPMPVRLNKFMPQSWESLAVKTAVSLWTP